MRINNLKLRFNNFCGRVKTAINNGANNFRDSNCGIKGCHQHVYHKGVLSRLMSCEKLRKEGYDWTNDFVWVEAKDEKLAKFIERKRLLSIEDNIEFLRRKKLACKDYIEYEIEEEPSTPFTLTQIDEDTIMFTPNESTYSWTSDPNARDKTGERRLVHTMYQAYKVEQKSNGKYKLVRAPLADDITLTSDEYPFFRENCACEVYRKLKKM